MYTFLLVLLAIDSVVLIAVILMQAGQGGGMAATGVTRTNAPEASAAMRQRSTSAMRRL